MRQCNWKAGNFFSAKEARGILKHSKVTKKPVGAFGVLAGCKKTLVGDGRVGYDDKQVVCNYATSKLINGILSPYHAGNTVFVKGSNWSVSVPRKGRR